MVLIRRLLVVGGGALAVAAAAWAVGVGLGYTGFAFAWTVHLLMMAWMAASMQAVRPALSSGWFRVRRWEPRVLRWLGVWRYMLILRYVGWERANRSRRAFDGTRSSLAGYERETRESETSHLILAGIGTVLVAVAVYFQAWTAVAWLGSLNVVLHVYPVLLQRAVRARLQRLLGHTLSTNTPQPR